MKYQELSKLSDKELPKEIKKLKKTSIINAFLIGFLIGIIIYSVAVNNFGFLMVILLFVIYKMVNTSKYDKKELENILKERQLK